MEYRELTPGPFLTPYVAAFWTLRGSCPVPSFDLVLPDGHAEVVVHRAGRFLEWHASDDVREQPAAIVAGVADRAVVLSPAGAYETVGIRLMPYALARLCDGPLDALGSGIASAELVLAPGARRLMAAAVYADSLEEAVRVLQRGLRELFERVPPAPPAVVAAVRRIRRTSGAIPVDRLAGETGASARTLERQFDAWVGLSPKRYARVVRFHRAVGALIAAPDVTGARHAAEHGYYDQAHFTSEFKAFTGWAPKAFANQKLGELTRHFVAPSREGR